MNSNKEQLRKKRHAKVRSRVSGNAKTPRLVVFRSLTAIYAQLIDDTNGVVLAESSSAKATKGTKIENAKLVGINLAKKALAKKLKTCVFDRGGYLYHGRVKALAEGAREGGLQF